MRHDHAAAAIAAQVELIHGFAEAVSELKCKTARKRERWYPSGTPLLMSLR